MRTKKATNKFILTMFVLMLSAFCGSATLKAQWDPGYVDPYNESSTDPEYQQEQMDNFQQTLSEDGRWVRVSREEIDPDNSGAYVYIDEDVNAEYIWVPNTEYVYVDWNPYTNGHWTYTYWGWEWVSDYSWGYAPYHYGRWWHSAEYGWVWSPGYRWAPSWVDWCYSDNYNYIGWCSVSPREHWDWDDHDYSYWHDYDHDYEHHHDHDGYYSNHEHEVNPNWVFVHNRDFTHTITPQVIIGGPVKEDLINTSTNIAGLRSDGQKIYNNGPKAKDFGFNETKQITPGVNIQKTGEKSTINDGRKNVTGVIDHNKGIAKTGNTIDNGKKVTINNTKIDNGKKGTINNTKIDNGKKGTISNTKIDNGKKSVERSTNTIIKKNSSNGNLKEGVKTYIPKSDVKKNTTFSTEKQRTVYQPKKEKSPVINNTQKNVTVEKKAPVIKNENVNKNVSPKKDTYIPKTKESPIVNVKQNYIEKKNPAPQKNITRENTNVQKTVITKQTRETSTPKVETKKDSKKDNKKNNLSK